MPPRETRRTTHRWIVDGVEEDIARIVEDGARAFHVPCSLLPIDAREGHVLTVLRVDEDSTGVRMEITIDAAATEAARTTAQADAAHTLAASKRRDEGGDVAL